MSTHRRTKKGQSNGDYKVGYGKPPIETRFKPGESGNKKGRPKKTMKSWEELKAEFLKQRLPLVENGVVKFITAAEAIVRQQGALALRGNPNARDFFANSPSTKAGPQLSFHGMAMQAIELEELMKDDPPADGAKRVAK